MKDKPLRSKIACALVASVLLAVPCSSAMAVTPAMVSPQEDGEMVLESKSSPVKVTLGMSGGFLTGQATELVYWPWMNNHKASELIWKIDSLYMVGLSASLEVMERFSVNVNGWFKAADGSGTMDDYDWLYTGGEWSHWSHHDNTDVVTGNIIDISGEYAAVKTENLALSGIIGFKRDNFGWESRGGTYTYSSDGFRDTSGNFPDVPAISYEQTYYAFYFGLGCDFDIEKFHLESKLVYSPFVSGEAEDTHHMRNLYTNDDFENGDMVAFEVKGAYNFVENFSVELGYSYQWYDIMQGNSEWQYRDQGITVQYDDGAGMDLSYSLFSCSIRYTF